MTLARIQIRRDTPAAWAALNPVLADGELATDGLVLKIGDGQRGWSELPAATPDAATMTRLLATAAAVEGAVAPTDAAMAAAIATPGTATEQALSNTIVSTVGAYNLADFGAVPGTSSSNAATNDAAWAAMMDAIPTVGDSFGGVAPTIYIPAGIWTFSDNLVIPSTKRCRIVGAGSYTSILRRAADATGDLLTVEARATNIAHLGFDGNRSTDTDGGDLLVIDAPFCVQSDLFIINSCQDGMSVGKTATAINNKADNIVVRFCKRYGIRVNSGTDTTDVEFDRCNVGQSGLSGFRIDAAAGSYEMCHSWSNGIEETSGTDYDGFRIGATGNRLHDCEGETNLGAGVSVRTGAHRTQIVGGRYWGNVRNGIAGISAYWCNIVGATVSQNGVANTDGTSSTSYSGINLDSCLYWAVVGNVAQDFATAIPAASYPSTPSKPYPGKSGILTQSRAYTESGSTDYITIVGNTFRQEDTRNGVWATIVGANNIYAANILGAGAAPNPATFTVGEDATSNPTLKLNGAAGSVRRFELQTAHLSRWFIQASTGSESGSNAGSDLEILARSDAGSALSTPVTIQRATGRVAFSYPIRVPALATTSRPAASAVGAGGHMFDTTLGKPIWSDGTNWKDATGATV